MIANETKLNPRSIALNIINYYVTTWLSMWSPDSQRKMNYKWPQNDQCKKNQTGHF